MDVFTGIFGIVISLVCFWTSFKFLKLYFKVRSWDRIDAKVLSKEITLHKKYSTARSPYKINAPYLYFYNEQEFHGERVYLVELLNGQANHMKSDAERRIAKIEDTMKIYVDPKDPKESVMYCKGFILYCFISFMGIFSLLLAISKLM